MARYGQPMKDPVLGGCCRPERAAIEELRQALGISVGTLELRQVPFVDHLHDEAR